jgi:hypothetical protein
LILTGVEPIMLAIALPLPRARWRFHTRQWFVLGADEKRLGIRGAALVEDAVRGAVLVLGIEGLVAETHDLGPPGALGGASAPGRQTDRENKHGHGQADEERE